MIRASCSSSTIGLWRRGGREMRLPADATLMVIGAPDAIDGPRPPPREKSEEKIAALIVAWRAEGLPIVHIGRNAIELGATPLAGATMIDKAAESAFGGAGLEDLLDEIGATTLVLCGALTPSLEATARDAADLGYQVFIVGDACWAIEGVGRRGTGTTAEDAHAGSLARLQRDYGRIVDTAAALNAAASAKARQRRAAERHR